MALPFTLAVCYRSFTQGLLSYAQQCKSTYVLRKHCVIRVALYAVAPHRSGWLHHQPAQDHVPSKFLVHLFDLQSAFSTQRQSFSALAQSPTVRVLSGLSGPQLPPTHQVKQSLSVWHAMLRCAHDL
jgi:hypothetical protein